MVLIFEKREAFALARFLVADQVDINRFAVLRADCDDIAFCQIERKSTNVDIRSVTVVRMP